MGFQFIGALESLLGTTNFQASNPATQFFGFRDVPDRVGGDIIPYAAFIDNDFTVYETSGDVVNSVLSYLSGPNLAGPTDAVEVTGTKILTADRNAGAWKLVHPAR